MTGDLQLSPSIIVIFGITGDLSKRYLLPALYHLCKDNLLPEPTIIIGTSRQKLELDEFLGQVELCVLEQDNVCDPVVLKRLRNQLELVQLDPTEAKDYDQLSKRLAELEDAHGLCLNRLYYLSIPPQIYGPVIRNLGHSDLNGSCQHGQAATRLLVEKPFGYDLVSAEDLIHETTEYFDEQQIFRIDHYLAKEVSQEILPFRSHNPTFEALWNTDYITEIEVIATESLGVEGRKFYDQIGALRDLVQSHLLQLLALTTMELPSSMASQAIHRAKEDLLRRVRPPAADTIHHQVVRGQYEGYREAVGNVDSTTETFVSLTVQIPTPRWQGTTLRLTTGKALKEKRTEVTVRFKAGEVLTFQIQPDGKIELPDAKSEPLATTIKQATTNFIPQNDRLVHDYADAYEHVILNAIRGDHTLFATSGEILASWRVLQPILDSWAKDSGDLRPYVVGSNGPTSEK